MHDCPNCGGACDCDDATLCQHDCADFLDDDWDHGCSEDEPCCPWCGGDGVAEYDECPEVWGDDCPSEVNHLITCPQCRGSGLAKDCDVL